MKTDRQVAIHFTWHEALQEDVTALGGRKKVAARLWPGEDEETASSRLRAAMAPDHKQELKPTEVLRIKEWAHHEADSHALMRYEDGVLGCRHEWIDAQEELCKLLRERNAAKDIDRARDERIEMLLTRLEARSLKAVPR